MKRISYFKIFGFLAFAGSAFLSTVFHYPVFTVTWFIIMLLFMVANCDETSEMIILAFSALAYIPLGLISIFGNYLNNVPESNNLSEFAWLMVVFVVVELVLSIIWIAWIAKCDNKKN